MVTSDGGRGLVAAKSSAVQSIRSIGTGISFEGGAIAFQENDSNVDEWGNGSSCRNDGSIPDAAHVGQGGDNVGGEDENHVDASVVDDNEDTKAKEDRCDSGWDDPEVGHNALVSAESIQRFLEEKLRMNKSMVSSARGFRKLV